MRDNARVQETGFACKATIQLALESRVSPLDVKESEPVPFQKWRNAAGDRLQLPITMERDSV